MKTLRLAGDPSFFSLPYTEAACPKDPLRPAAGPISRPIINVGFKYKGKESAFFVECIVDSGADFCIFPAETGEELGIPIKSGPYIDTQGTGKARAYFHRVKLVLNLRDHAKKKDRLREYDYDVGFSWEFGNGVLGRRGFFNHFSCVTFREDQSCFGLHFDD